MITSWMASEPVVVDPQTSLQDCREFLQDGLVRYLIVADDVLIGVLDAPSVFAPGCRARVVGELSFSEPLSAPVRTPAAEVLATLHESSRDVVVLLDESMPVGTFSEHDAVRVAAELLPLDLPITRFTTKPVLTIDADVSVADARVRLEEGVVRHFIVTHRDEMLGVLSWRDLRVARDEERVSECVAALQWSIGWGESLRNAAARMARYRIGLLPVLGATGVEAVLSRTDVITALREHLQSVGCIEARAV